MKYACDMTLDLPRDRVVELMDNEENLYKWQKSLVKYEHESGEPGQVGAVSRQHHKMGKREVHMTETITVRDFPNQFSAIYAADGVWNQIENYFTENPDGTTHWHLTSEFRCKGFMRVMCWLLPGMFKKQTQEFMMDFKKFAEGEKATGG